ncbi:uncharacterized protein METZ01_LOCUS60997 [marine metagenome]|uniref:Uncharacterized protein n=1 Tax=marine metagenome TaxID=408172 RepID=A0A381T381_9ZZZZ
MVEQTDRTFDSWGYAGRSGSFTDPRDHCYGNHGVVFHHAGHGISKKILWFRFSFLHSDGGPDDAGNFVELGLGSTFKTAGNTNGLVVLWTGSPCRLDAAVWVPCDDGGV